MANFQQQQDLPTNPNERPLAFFPLMLFLAVGVSFIGWNFGGVKGALIGFACTCVINIYALTIKNE